MNRKYLIISILFGPIIALYKLLYLIVSRFHHLSLSDIPLTTPIIYGSIISIVSYLLLGLKHGIITTVLIASTLLSEYHLDQSNLKSEVENDIVHF